MLTLLFSWDFQLLGEFAFEEGRFQHVSLSSEGQRRLGDLISEWHTKGIELKERLSQTTDGETRHVMARRYIRLSAPEACAAFTCWAADEGNIALELPARLLEHWQKLCSLELEPEERFASLQALRHAPHRLVEAWEKGLDEMLQKATHERASATASVMSSSR